ncbi:type II toxin-antitoxin system PemK/MazF family toxin [Baaleninema sp.]|uniref:type II toxin-antitoxin system PemK/MazF family toxin n=1 Tax=Baaleninema sp. TaxID=3101197 RepID=UPI003CFD346E
MSTTNSSKDEVLLVRYPFSDLSRSKIRPAVVVSEPHISQDIIVVPLTSRTSSLLPGEFVLTRCSEAGFNVETAFKRGLYTVDRSLAIKKIGQLAKVDIDRLEQSLRVWLGL